MDLEKCPDCSREVSRNAKRCPHCGGRTEHAKRVEDERIKFFAVAFIVVVAFISLCSELSYELGM